MNRTPKQLGMMDISGNRVDHYSKMLFKMGQAVMYNGNPCTITGWSTNDNETSPNYTYKYQLNKSGTLVQEKNLTAVKAAITN